MTSEEIARIESTAKIRSEEEFIQKCEELGIPRSWYSFTEDRSCKVYLDGRSVHYDIMGMTTCAVKLCVYDVMFEKLLDCKKDYEFEQSNAPLRIERISFGVKENISKYLEYPYVVLFAYRYECDTELDPFYLEAGWKPSGRDYYMGTYTYEKTVDIRDILTTIDILFMKRTEQRDTKAFGMTVPIMRGKYSYKIPPDLLEEVAKAQHSRSLSKKLREKIIDRYANCIIEDEYNALLRLGPEYMKALKEVLDRNLSAELQEKALRAAALDVEKNNPGHDHLIGCRGCIVGRNALAKVKNHLGI